MKTYQKTTPKVKNGKVQKKQNYRKTPNYWNTRQDEVQVDIEKPGKGFKHFLKKRDIHKFLGILPHWDEIGDEFDAVLLAQGGGADGWYNNGIIAICAWEKEMTICPNKWYFEDHKNIFDRLNIEYEVGRKKIECHINKPQIIAYQLLLFTS